MCVCHLLCFPLFPSELLREQSLSLSTPFIKITVCFVLDRYIVKDRVKLFCVRFYLVTWSIKIIEVVLLSSEMESISIWSSVNSVGAKQNDFVEKLVVFFFFLRDVV